MSRQRTVLAFATAGGWFAATLFVLALLPAVAAAQSVAVETGAGSDRLVFPWPQKVDYSVQKFGNALVVEFDRRVTADISAVSRGAGRFVSRVALDQGGRSVIVDLKENPRFRSQRDGNNVVVELFPRDGTPPPQPAPGTVAAPSVPRTQGQSTPPPPELAVRIGQHEGYSRLVFDWPQQTGYRVAEEPGRAVLTFDRRARVDDTAVRRGLPDALKGFQSRDTGQALEVTVPLPAGSRIRHFQTGPRVVADVLFGPGGAAAAVAPAAPSPSGSTGVVPPPAAAGQPPAPSAAATEVARRLGIAVPSAPADAPTPAASAAPAAVAAAPAAVPPTASAPVAPPTIPPPSTASPVAAPRQAVPEPEAFGTATRFGAMTMPINLPSGTSIVEMLRQQDVGTIAGPAIAVTSTRANEAVSVRFEWTQPAAAAIFTRGNYLWAVFDSPATFDLRGVNTENNQLIGRAEQVPVSSGSALRIPTIAGVNPRVWRDGAVWIVDLQAQVSHPDVSLGIDTQLVSAQGPRVFIPAEGLGQTAVLRDPEVGDRLFVVPLAQLSRGVDSARRFAEFMILASVQGIAVQPFADDLTLRTLPDGVAITRGGGLTISRVSAQSADEQVARRIDGLPPGLAPGRIFDFTNWRKGDSAKFRENKQAIQRRISESTSIARSGPRLELAHFYFAHGLAAEAMGLLRTIQSDDEELARRPDVKALRGAAQFMLGRYKEAEEDLMDRNLNGFSEAELWRGAVKAAQGRWPEAVEHFSRAGELPGGYPRSFATQMALLAAEAAIRAGDYRGAGGFIDAVAEGQPTPSDQARLNYLRGRVLYASGDVPAALDFWRRLSDGEDRWARVRSERALIEHNLAGKTISRTDAIQQLERLRYTWRGDQLEFDLLRELGKLYLQEKEYVNGLDALRQAVTYFPDNLYAEQVTREMTDGFASVFTGGASDSMTPIQALTLYDQFRELTPVGARGDEIIQRLADRLVQVDLLDRASILLERQVKFRLQGRDKARVGARLALIRLLDRRPEDAIKALDESVAPGIEAPLALERKRLRARAEFELGDAAGALGLLQGDNSRDADLLRADIFWRTQNWAAAADVFQRLVGRAGQDGRRITESQATLILNWAASLSLSNRLDELNRVRQIYTQQMDNTPFREAFRLITNRTDGDISDFRTLTERFKEIGRFQAFLSSYRDRLKDAPLSATN